MRDVLDDKNLRSQSPVAPHSRTGKNQALAAKRSARD
jgi:hypothetical protein